MYSLCRFGRGASNLFRRKSNNLCAGLLLLAAACSGGGGGPSSPEIPASIPAGAGSVLIDMAGTWSIQDTLIIDSNAPAPNPPIDGTLLQFEPGRIVTIGGFSVDAALLESLVGLPLESYVNQIDASRVFFAVAVDRRPLGGSRQESALAGGAIDNNTILVEAFNSAQSSSDPVPLYTLSRYRLVRVAGTTLLQHQPETWTADDFLRAVFGDSAGGHALLDRCQLPISEQVAVAGSVIPLLAIEEGSSVVERDHDQEVVGPVHQEPEPLER